MFKEYILLDTCDFLGKLLLALDVALAGDHDALGLGRARAMHGLGAVAYGRSAQAQVCLLYTSDAADEL